MKQMQKHSRKMTVIGAALATLLINTPAQANECAVSYADDLKLVGETRLSVMFWDVYDARLYTDSGAYEDAKQRLLRLDYLRDIDASDLVETTAEEWERLDYEIDSETKDWLASLSDMWPNVKEGDCITLRETENGYAEFYGNDGLLGTVESKTFTQRFLDIWLAENSRFEDERNELIGESK